MGQQRQPAWRAPAATFVMAVLVGCGAGTADDTATLAASAPDAMQAAVPVASASATVASDDPAAATPPSTAPTPAEAAVGTPAASAARIAPALRDALRPAGTGTQAPSPRTLPLPLDIDATREVVIECAVALGQAAIGGDATRPPLPECPAGDALPPASSPWFVSAVPVVDPTAGRYAGALPRLR